MEAPSPAGSESGEHDPIDVVPISEPDGLDDRLLEEGGLEIEAIRSHRFGPEADRPSRIAAAVDPETDVAKQRRAIEQFCR